jgi:membrane-associated phospholipid phosphatase
VLPLLAIALASFLTLALIVQASPRVRGWDESAASWVAEEVSPSAGGLAHGLTQIGSSPVYLAVTAVVTVALLVTRRFRLAGFLACVVLGQWMLSNLLKHLFERERPDFAQVVDAYGYSLPSGHATASAAVFLSLALVVAAVRPRWNRTLLIGSAIGLAVLVASTRVVLGVHWTTDVLAGLALGWAWCLICALAFRVWSVPLPAHTEHGRVPT